MKVCCTCKLALEESKFNKKSTARDGLAANCRECSKAYSKQWNMQNRQEQLLKKKIYRENNKLEISEIKKRWYEKNRDYCKKRNRANYYKNQEEYKQKTKKYYIENYEKCLADRRNYYIEHKLRFNALAKKWRNRNKDLCNFYSRTYTAAKIQATPKWLTEEHMEQIKEIYKEAQELKWLNEGEAFHVDHIVPLRGDNACGLHVPWNLQLLSPSNNLKKNKRLCVKVVK